ncbi:MarR family transcriptional regulator [Bacillus nakamurai]|uniref:MarR family transcriptional regulator n=1 Tax=Bacillus nakamurai TaxID=1793963 RepID=A0A150FAH8_9BACI|nr:MarR family transcriptional regulator [Bacillus nakamurai]KXZ15010.1 MarR family transcriptional regulator [Bacillus nakamurai]KXZ22230.1 MarR family transcriptional regulator [Bacillus nakamurai]MCC9020834.1 MarR family transcriptional regulator [Bacillus nakamurai]MED1228553.1 MarR family transcriptional regulator [Bacillus nakamurai]
MHEEKVKQLIQRYADVYLHVMKKIDSIIAEKVNKELTLDQYYILRYIMLHPGCKSIELAAVCHVNKSAITSMTNRLFEKGYINRERSQSDRRSILLNVTEKGTEVFHRVERQIEELVRSYIMYFAEDEAEMFVNTYEKLYRLMLTEEERLT